MASDLRKRAEHLWRGVISHSSNSAARGPAIPAASNDASSPSAPELSQSQEAAMSKTAGNNSPEATGGANAQVDPPKADRDAAVIEELRAERKPKPAAEEE